MEKQKVLVVDDEEALLEIISYALKDAGYEVRTATDASQAAQVMSEFEPSLIILDVMLPGRSGLEFCQDVRRKSDIPIVILSARTDEVDKILGLELGADDYVTKPFSPRELVSRVRAQLRRAEAHTKHLSPVIQIKDLRINTESHQVFLRGKLIHLTNSEFQILLLLARSPGKVFSRTTILNYLWGGGFIGDERTVDVHVHNLRNKIEEDPQKPGYLYTVRALGYRLCEQ